MLIKNFRTLDLSIEVYQLCTRVQCPAHLKSQLLRAASSISLNVAEGSAKPTEIDSKRFNAIALGSQREVLTIFHLLNLHQSDLAKMLDQLGASLYRLNYPKKNRS